LSEEISLVKRIKVGYLGPVDRSKGVFEGGIRHYPHKGNKNIDGHGKYGSKKAQEDSTPI